MRTLTVLAVATLLLACTGEAEKDPAIPGTIKLGVLPDQSKDTLIERYSLLVDYLSKRTALDIELVVPDDYSSMLDDFSARRIHIANFGGLTFTQAELRGNAEPLVMRDTDLNFASCYLVPAADDRGSVADFEGEIFAFGPELSTSGHLMPRYFLQAADLDPDTFFASIRHSSGHDETAVWVRDGEVGIGVANCVIVGSMNADGRLPQTEVRVLETTPAYVNYVWAVQENMDVSLKIQLRDAFMALDALVPEHQAVLQELGATAYLPASRADFDDVRRAARDIEVAGMLAAE